MASPLVRDKAWTTSTINFGCKFTTIKQTLVEKWSKFHPKVDTTKAVDNISGNGDLTTSLGLFKLSERYQAAQAEIINLKAQLKASASLEGRQLGQNAYNNQLDDVSQRLQDSWDNLATQKAMLADKLKRLDKQEEAAGPQVLDLEKQIGKMKAQAAKKAEQEEKAVKQQVAEQARLARDSSWVSAALVGCQDKLKCRCKDINSLRREQEETRGRIINLEQV